MQVGCCHKKLSPNASKGVLTWFSLGYVLHYSVWPFSKGSARALKCVCVRVSSWAWSPQRGVVVLSHREAPGSRLGPVCSPGAELHPAEHRSQLQWSSDVSLGSGVTGMPSPASIAAAVQTSTFQSFVSLLAQRLVNCFLHVWHCCN